MKLQAECDVECYRNYFLVKFYLPDGTFRKFEMSDGSPPINLDALRATMYEFELVTFNGIGYDVPMIAAALMGFNCSQLKDCSDGIIQQNLRHWQFYRQFGVQELVGLQHIGHYGSGTRRAHWSKGLHGADALKDHAGSTRCARRDTNARTNAHYRQVQRQRLTETRLLKETIKNPLALRRVISEQIGVDVMSKSDAQIAEEVICSHLGYRPKKSPAIRSRYYEPPSVYSSSKPKQMRDVLRVMTTSEFIENDPDLPGAEIFTNEAG